MTFDKHSWEENWTSCTLNYKQLHFTLMITATNFHLKQLLNKPYQNKVILRENKISSKWCQPLKLLEYFGGRFRCHHTINKGSLGQRSAKWLAVKVGVFKKNLPLCPLQPKCLQARLAQVWIRMCLNHSQSLTDGKFAALWSTDPISPQWKI